MSEDDKALLLKILGFAIFFLVVMMILAVRTRRLYYRRIALSLIGDEEALWVRGPFSWISWKIADLRVRRILSPDGKRLAALEIAGGEEDDFFVIPVPATMEHQRAFLEQMAAWLVRRNVPVAVHQQVVPVPRWWWFALSFLAGALWVIVLIHGTSALVASGFFWIYWVFYGIPTPIAFLIWKVCGALAAFAILLSPVQSWLERLVTSRWWRLNRAQLDVLALDGGIDRRAALGGAGRAVLKTEGPAILLKAGKHQHRIAPSQVTHLERRNVNPKLKNRLLVRYFGRLVFLSWSGKDGHPQSVFLKVVSGFIMPIRNRRREKRLFEALQNWRQESKELDLSLPAIQPKRFGPLWAAAFVAACLLAFGLHNYLIGHYVRTGHLTPPARVQPAFSPCPLWYLYAVEAVPSGPLLGSTDRDTRFESWIYDPQTRRWRYPKVMMLMYYGPLSQPGGVTHFLQRDYFPLITMRFSFPENHDKAFWPTQIISLQTGLGRDLTSLPRGGAVALYKDEKVFYAVSLTDSPPKVPGSATVKITYDIGWVDARRDARHPLGQFALEQAAESFSIYSPPPAVFFPGGRFVLFGQTIVDLETGTRREAVFPTPGKMGYAPFRANDVFPMEDCLRIRILQSGWPKILTEVLEVDPVSARVEIIDQFPLGVSLLSADGDRWLLGQFVPSASPPTQTPSNPRPGFWPKAIPGKTIYTLYHHDSRTSETLFEEPNAPSLSYHLMAGRPELFVWSPKDGISVEPIERKQSKKLPN